MPIHADYKDEYNAMIAKYGEEKGKSVFYAKMNKQGVDYKKPRPGKSSKKEIKHSFLNGLLVKEDKEDLVVEGFIATDHMDLDNDIIPKTTLEKIADKVNRSSQANKVTLHHDRAETTVAGVMKNARVVQTNDGHWGVMVEATVNPAYPGYEDLAKEIEIGTIDGFSIEYETLQSHPQLMQVDGKNIEARVLEDLDIWGAGFASRAMNPEAKITAHTFKEFISFDNKEKLTVEVKKMKKKKEDAQEVVEPTEEPKDDVPKDDSVEEPAEESEESKEKLSKEFLKWKEMQKKEKLREELRTEILEAVKTMDVLPGRMPFIKEGMPLETKERLEKKEVEFKETVGRMQKFDTELKEMSRKGFSKEMHSRVTNMMFKEAAKIHNMNPSLPIGPMRNGFIEGKCETGFTDPGYESMDNAGTAGQNFEVKEEYWKALEYKANPLTSTTNQVSDTSYYQASADGADVYDPAIYNLLNDKTTFYGLLKKVDASKYGYRYGFRTRYSRSTVSGAQAEGATALTPSSTGRLRCQQPFVFYYAAVEATGPAIASARATGGIGDLMAAEVRDATLDLMRDINNDLLIGGEDGFDDGYECMSLSVLCEKGTSATELYGLSRNTYHLEGNSDALSTENISKGELRKVIRACVAGDSGLQANNAGAYSSANPADLIIVTHHLQKDKILSLFDDAQRFNSVSARAGFEGMPTFDGIPIHADNQCTNSILFVVDMQNTFLAVQVPPTFTGWSRYNYDTESGFIKTYFNLVCTAPGNNAYVSGLKTT